MITAAYFQNLLNTPKATLCVLSTATALLLSACTSTTDSQTTTQVVTTKTVSPATTVVVVSKDTSTENAIRATPNASDAPSNSGSAKRIYVSIPQYDGSAWSQADEEVYLKALQETDLVFDEDSKQLIHIKNATPLRTIIYQQNGITPVKRNDDDAMNTSPAGKQPAAQEKSESSSQSHSQTSTRPSTTSTSLVEVVSLASADSSATDASMDKPITPVTKPVRVSSVRDPQNHWQKSATPCRNCSNYYDYDPVYYEPFYQKFPTPGVDTK